ncbi:MAG: CPBP family intramembrane metalloprotease [Williamsia sp.]|nr:CPBP family intramembrane metalloprotease [Williamsia sp.]
MKDDQQDPIRLMDEVDEIELARPDFITVAKVIWFAIKTFFKERPGQIIMSAYLLLMLWGYHGNLELLHLVWNDYKGPGIELGTRPQLIAGIPWDNELISFWGGAFLVVVVPVLIIRFGFKEPLSSYGLGLPPRGRRSLAVIGTLVLLVVSLPAFYTGAHHPDMQALYPFYRPFTGVPQFLIYELMYLPFFIAIEFIFRGYLLFGLAGVKDGELAGEEKGFPGVFYFGRYALLIQMLSYTAWHLGKPIPEVFGTLFWGLAAGAVAYAIRSIWPIIIAHWLLNILLDGINSGLF